MEVIENYFLYFIIYAFLGWIMEVICKLIEKKKFINRGFLIGPICPIYGYGVTAIILLIGKNTSDILAVFLKSILICSILEYLTSYIMEKVFKARWWDYKERKFNINGRICLETMVPFGLLGCFIIYILHPLIKKLIKLINPTFKLILSITLLIIYITDNIISFKVMNKIKKEIKNQNVDNTELIKKKIHKWLKSNSWLYKHIENAYPKFIINKKRKNK